MILIIEVTGGKEEYLPYMRINGIEEISQVKKSYLGINGQISFIQKK